MTDFTLYFSLYKHCCSAQDFVPSAEAWELSALSLGLANGTVHFKKM